MRITFDPAKRDKTLAERGLDFADAALVFAGITLEVEDTRKKYGEPRIICYGYWRNAWSSWGTRSVVRIATFLA
jgi:uncharacterized protein